MSHELALELFRNACGLSAPLSLVCQEVSAPAGTSGPLDFPRPFLLIGRHPMADLYLNHPRISRRHVYLQAVAGRVFCVDLGSRTQTYWEGQEAAQSQGWLDPGRFIQVGPYRIHRTDHLAEAPPPSEWPDPFAAPRAEGSEPDPPPRVELELPFRAGRSATYWEMGGALALVGQSDHCQLVLADQSISRYHACLVRTPLGLWVVDLAAREGVHVNGTRVRWAWLGEGDLVRIGRFTLVLRYETAPERIDRADVPLEAGAGPIAPRTHRPDETPGSADRVRRSLALRSEIRRSDLVRAQTALPAFVPDAPATLNRGEWEPVLAPGPNPVAIWQQQMQLMETFHNDMIMMVQMFLAMHREHLASVRDELDRVQQLTRELTRLNARLGELPGPAEAGPTDQAGRPGREARPAAEAAAPPPEASPRPRSPQQGRKRAERKPEERTGAPGSTDRSAPVAKEQGKPRNVPPTTMGAPELYADLTRRITELQRERQGYWQRILNAING